MTHLPELFLAIVVVAVVAFLTFNRTSTTPPISAEPPDRPVSGPLATPPLFDAGPVPGD